MTRNESNIVDVPSSDAASKTVGAIKIHQILHRRHSVSTCLLVARLEQ